MFIAQRLFSLLTLFFKKARQSVCYSICFILIIIDSKMGIKKLLDLVNLTKAQTLSIHKLSYVIMISNNKDLVFAAF